jgi:hypothetical protein
MASRTGIHACAKLYRIWIGPPAAVSNGRGGPARAQDEEREAAREFLSREGEGPASGHRDPVHGSRACVAQDQAFGAGSEPRLEDLEKEGPHRGAIRVALAVAV